MAEWRIHAGETIAAGAVFIPVCTVMVGLRLWTRRTRNLKLGADDWLCVAALVFVIGLGATLIAEVGVGQLGYPQTDQSTVVGKPDANVGFWPVEVLQVPTLGLIKLSFIFFYRRIFEKRASPRFHIVSLIVIFVVAAWTISFFFSLLFICGTDFVAYWTSTVVEKEHCVNTNELHSAFAITDVITDVLVISMPLPMVWSLHLSMGNKIGVCLIFLLGALSIAASTIRAVVLLQAAVVNYDPNIDFEFLCTAGSYWSMIEAGLALCASCLPAQYGLFQSKGLQSLVRSVRSAVSLRSLSSRSTQNHQGTTTNLPSKTEDQQSQTSFVTRGESSTESSGSNGFKFDVSTPDVPVPQLPEHDIYVTHGFETTSERKV